MTPRKSGLIINVSSIGGLKYLFNAAYGIGKEAVIIVIFTKLKRTVKYIAKCNKIKHYQVEWILKCHRIL